MKKETVENLELKDLIKPSPDEVLVELQYESNEHVSGIQRINKGVESYVILRSIGESSVPFWAKEGDYILTRMNALTHGFTVMGKHYSIIYKHQCQSYLHPLIVKEFSADKQKVVKPTNTIQVVN